MIINLPSIVPQNSFWTTERLVTALRNTMSSLVGEELNTYQIRLFLNIGLSRASAFISQYKPELYSIRLQGSAVTTTYGGREFKYKEINLGQPVTAPLADAQKQEKSWPTTPGYGTLIPWTYVKKVVSVSHSAKLFNANLKHPWHGPLTALPAEKFFAVSSENNDQWRQDICWTQVGDKIYVWAGTDVLTNTQGDYWYKDDQYELTVVRKPIYDDMLPIDLGVSNYSELADIPDEGVTLLLQYALEHGMQALGKQVDPAVRQATQITESSFLASIGNVPTPAQ